MSIHSKATPEAAIQLFEEPDVQECFHCILSYSKFGLVSEESAAFVLKVGSSYQCYHWPSNESKQATFRGVIPSNTIAIVHSHPQNSSTQPSQTDEEVTARLNIPNFVVTRLEVWASVPVGYDRKGRVEVESIQIADQRHRFFKQNYKCDRQNFLNLKYAD